MGQKKRDTYKYQFKVGNKIVHGGITNDLERCEREHKQTYGQKGHIKQVGRRTTEEAARQWKQEKTHVVPAPNGGWNVKKGDARRRSKHFDTKQDAVKWGTAVSRKQGTQFVIHRKDGTIEK